MGINTWNVFKYKYTVWKNGFKYKYSILYFENTENTCEIGDSVPIRLKSIWAYSECQQLFRCVQLLRNFRFHFIYLFPSPAL